MSAHDPLVTSRTIDHSKPLAWLQEYLVAAKATCVLLKELLVELKEVIVMVALIGFFILGVWHAFHHLL